MNSRFTHAWPTPPGLHVRYVRLGNFFVPRTHASSQPNWRSESCVASSRNTTSYSCPWYCSTSSSLSQYPSRRREPLGYWNERSSAAYLGRMSPGSAA